MNYWIKCTCIALVILIFTPWFNVGNHAIRDESSNNGESEEIFLSADSLFVDDSEVFRYAYMDLERADESLKTKIIQARNIVICNSSWVADGVNGYVEDEEEGTIRELPHFSEIFPSDWEMPTFPAQEDEQFN